MAQELFDICSAQLGATRSQHWTEHMLKALLMPQTPFCICWILIFWEEEYSITIPTNLRDQKMLVHCWPIVCDTDPTLNQRCLNFFASKLFKNCVIIWNWPFYSQICHNWRFPTIVIILYYDVIIEYGRLEDIHILLITLPHKGDWEPSQPSESNC